MSHIQQIQFVSLVSQWLLKSNENKKILEIGSHDVNGSLRKVFSGNEFTGVDLSPGEGVDVVASGHEVEFHDGSFDLTVSSECFEHNPYWAETFQNMHRMTKKSGLVVITCASRGRFEHGTTRSGASASPGTDAIGWNYYRNLNKSDFDEKFKLSEMFSQYLFFYIPMSQDLYFVGWKGNNLKDFANTDVDLDSFIQEVRKIRTLRNPGVKSVRFIAILEKLLLSPFTLLDDTTYQNIVHPYVLARGCVRRKLRKALQLK